MRFAIDEINRNPTLLPNLTLGFQVYDSCGGIHQELDGTLKMLTGQKEGVPNFNCKKIPPVISTIGHSTSTFSILNAHVLGLYRYPQISYLASSSVLSDKTRFPSFFRTVPSDAFQSKGLAQLVLHFGWTWVGFVAVDDDYGHQGIQVVKQEILRGGACVAFTEYIMSNNLEHISYVTKVIKASTAKAIISFTNDINKVFLLDEMLRQNVTGKLFVASEAWSISYLLSVTRYSSLLAGSIGFSFHSMTIAGFNHFLNSIRPFNTDEGPWTTIFWENVFGCKFIYNISVTNTWGNDKVCTGNESMESILNSDYGASNLNAAFNLYSASHVIAKSLHDMLSCQKDNGPFKYKGCTDIQNFRSWQLSYYIQNVNVKLSNGREVFFDKNGDPPAVYDIVNWQVNADGAMRHVKVGIYDTTRKHGNILVFVNLKETLLDSKLEMCVPVSVCTTSCPVGFRKVLRRDMPVCCFECVSCPLGEISNMTGVLILKDIHKDKCHPKSREFLSFEEPLGSTIATISVFSSSLPFSIFGLFICYKNTPIVRANNFSLSCLLLISMSLCFLSSLAFIGYPQPEKCLLRQVTFGTVFTLCVSCILAKTFMVVFAFMATKPDSGLKRWASPRVSYIIVALSSFLQLVLCISWISLAPPFTEDNIQTKRGIIIVECNEGSPTAFWCMLGYLGLLATISFIVAFLARRLPDSFNEAKFITFSMLAFLSVWVSYIPASLSSTGKYTVAMEVFAILSSTWALVICMFAPKCFIILFRPDMNSRGHLMGKSKI
uniref:G-protein coupled receptors family 3 profile domain-containing protein n=1 Tax=Leptobrachium leishanense TaxID=445787 RepID=A0A8C5PCB3_9ANUR